MSEERRKIDEDLKKEIIANKKVSEMDVEERAKMMEGKIPMKKPEGKK
jgi:hypothetical protein